MKKFFIGLVIILTTFSLIGCDFFAPEEKEFSGAGITIMLDESFTQEETVIVPFYLESFNHIFMGSREEKLLFVGTEIENLQQYIEAVLDYNGNTSVEVNESEDGYDYLYAYYSSVVDDIEYGYMMVCMEGEDHYYIMNFGCLNSKLEDYKEQYIEWANTIAVE